MGTSDLIPEIGDYIRLVRSGEFPACREQQLLCNYIEQVFSEENLQTDTGKLGKYLELQKYFPYSLFPWEKFCFALHNCVYRTDGQLRWPELFALVGRGAGKNGYLAFEDFCLLTPINGVKEYHIDICANSEDQAKTTFDDLYNLLEGNKPRFQRAFYWNKELIRNKKTGSVLRYRTNNYKSKDGGRPGKIDYDEYHQYENYKSIEVFETGLGKKAYPRITIITTNGIVRDGPFDHKLDKALRILEGAEEDNGLLPFICRLDDPKEVWEPKAWHKANPSLRYFPFLQSEMEREFANYKLDPLGNQGFLTRRMNRPQGDPQAEVTSWDNLVQASRPLPDLEGRPCVFGMDYAQINDFLAAGILFRDGPGYAWITHTWVCRQSADLYRIKAPLDTWESQGLLTFVDNVEISPEYPLLWLMDQMKQYHLVYGGMDYFRFSLVSRALHEAGFEPEHRSGGKTIGNLKLVRPSDQMLISPKLQQAFAKGQICWGENPIMRWYVNNAKRIIDPRGNVVYGKQEPKSRKTDGFMALVAAFACTDILDEYEKMLDPGDLPCYTY